MSALVSARPGLVEFDILCRLARPHPDLERASLLIRGGIDFPTLNRLAGKHGVRPQLIGGLRSLSWQAVPPAERDSLEAYQRFHGARALALGEELGRLAAAFAGKGIAFVTFKGPALAAALYGDLARREYADLDILVHAHQLDDAERLLESVGYAAAAGDRAFRRAFLGYLRQCAFVHSGIDAVVDLHWAFSGVHVPFPLAVADAWRDIGHVTVGAHVLPTVTGENLALLLAGHGTKESWRCLGWVADFALLIDRQPELDWSAVHRRARAQGCGNTVLLGCALALELLGTPVPSEIAGLIAGSPRVPTLAADLARKLRAGELESLEEENFTDFNLCDSRIDKLKAVLRLAVMRTSGDYEAMKLPQALWPVYYATRPFRLAAKALSALR